MSRELLLWQIRWQVYFYTLDRLFRATHDPLWMLYEQALETGDWDEYRAVYEARG